MADSLTYQKKRKEFGRPPQFEDTETKIVGSIIPNTSISDNYILRDPNKLIIDNIPIFSEHSVRRLS
jgi:dynein intermediate chain 2